MHMPRRILSREPLPHRSGPRVIYLTHTDLPSGGPDALQSMHTCWEMAQRGVDVVLVVRKLSRSRRDCLASYGLSDQPRLRLTSVSLPMRGEFNDWRGRTFRTWLRSALNRWATAGSTILAGGACGWEVLRLLQEAPLDMPITTVFDMHDTASLQPGPFDTADRGAARVEQRSAGAQSPGNPDGIVCPTETVRRWLQERLGTAVPMRVIPNPGRIDAGVLEAASGVMRVQGDLWERRAEHLLQFMDFLRDVSQENEV
jgi:hypothetical protein